MRELLSAVLGPWRRSTYRYRERFGVSVTRPVGEPIAHATGLDPDRILVIGNGLAVGWGVRIHDLALIGHLAREITATTGRGSSVRTIADPGLGILSAARLLAGSNLTPHDAVIVILGASDAFDLISPRLWNKHMTVLVECLRAQVGASPIFFMGIPPISQIKFFHTRPHGVTDQWASHLNAITEAICYAAVGVTYVPPLPSPSTGSASEAGVGQRYRGPDEYRSVARHLATRVVPILQTGAASTHHDEVAAGETQTSRQRHDALAELGVLDTPPEERFDHLVSMARTVFGTESAAFTLIDDDRQWHKAAVGVSTREDPLEDSFCATTIQTCAPFIVEDALNDDRHLPQTSVRFYAGHPVEAPDGTRIGAICVFDRNPKTPTPVQLSFLRELALTIQHELTRPRVRA